MLWERHYLCMRMCNYREICVWFRLNSDLCSLSCQLVCSDRKLCNKLHIMSLGLDFNGRTRHLRGNDGLCVHRQRRNSRLQLYFGRKLRSWIKFKRDVHIVSGRFLRVGRQRCLKVHCVPHGLKYQLLDRPEHVRHGACGIHLLRVRRNARVLVLVRL